MEGRAYLRRNIVHHHVGQPRMVRIAAGDGGAGNSARSQEASGEVIATC